MEKLPPLYKSNLPEEKLSAQFLHCVQHLYLLVKVMSVWSCVLGTSYIIYIQVYIIYTNGCEFK